jgi:hypothetical protein
MSEVSVAFASPEGEELRFDWDTETLDRLDPSAAEEPWRLAGELDWDEIDAVRVLSARLDDGSRLAIAAIRPAGAEGHGEEAISGLLVADGAVEELDQVLLSTEYDGEGKVSRIGLELYRADGGIPLRVAGEATAVELAERGDVRHQRTELRLRSGDAAGPGLYEILRRG